MANDRTNESAVTTLASDDRLSTRATTAAKGAKSSQFAELGIGEGSRVGRYVLGAKLGEGGMGSVFVAQQLEPVQRRVAFKVIQLGMNTEDLLRRFEAERQILALLEHPNVATMYDAGATPGGRPYFVMEFVDGIEIDAFCSQHQLTIRQRIELFIQVLAGLEHAHQKGIIHCDIKPGNIVVSRETKQPVAKIIDFGISKSLSDNIAGATQHGEAIGTPRYMAPEQARLTSAGLDVRTDIFSLGAVLYELLVGISPFASSSSDDFREDVSNRESMTPAQGLTQASANIKRLAEDRRVSKRTLVKLLSGDIASVVLKALKSERTERYRSVSEFSDDLRRYLEGFPVIAKPRRFWYLAARFATRRKAVIASTAVVTVALIGTTIAAVMGFLQAEKAASEAILIAEFQATQLSRIDASAMGQDLRVGMLEKVRAELQLRGLGAQDINSKINQLEQLIEGANFTDLALEMLDVNIFDRALLVIDKDFNEQPLIQARLWQTVADTLRELGRLERATTPQQRSLDNRRRLLGNEHPDTLASIKKMGFLLKFQGELAAAEPYFREALAIERRRLGNQHPDTLDSINNIGALLHSQGKFDAAERYFREALEALRRVLGDEHPNTIASINNMGMLLQSKGDLTAAEPYIREALETNRRVLGDADLDTLLLISNMGLLLQSQGKLVEAEPYYREALETRRRVLGDEHPDTLVSINNMGKLLQDQGKFVETQPYFRKALETNRRVLGDEHPNTLISIYNMGALLRDLGDLEEAEALGREATEVARIRLGDQNVYLGIFLSSYGKTLTASGRFAEAKETLNEAHAILSDPATGGELYVKRPVKALIELFDAWQQMAPDQGHDRQAAQWRQRLVVLSGE